MKKLTPKQKKLVKEYAKSLQSKRLNETAPGSIDLKELDSYEENLTVTLEDCKDEFVSFLIEMDDTIGTTDPLYRRLEKLITHFDIINKALPHIFKEYKTKIGL